MLAAQEHTTLMSANRMADATSSARSVRSVVRSLHALNAVWADAQEPWAAEGPAISLRAWAAPCRRCVCVWRSVLSPACGCTPAALTERVAPGPAKAD